MTDICIPITHLGKNQIAEVTVSFGNVQQKHSFRVEAFPWDTHTSIEKRILFLKRMIEDYDRNWELIQIYNPGTSAEYIHVLFKLKSSASLL